MPARVDVWVKLFAVRLVYANEGGRVPLPERGAVAGSQDET